MVKNCCVRQCKNQVGKGEKRKYHTFPKEESLKAMWISRIGKTPTKHTVVCSDHFKETDYGLTNYGDPSPLLKKGAVPSMKLPKSSLEFKGVIGDAVMKERSHIIRNSHSHIVGVSTLTTSTCNFGNENIILNDVADSKEIFIKPVQRKQSDKSTMVEISVESIGIQATPRFKNVSTQTPFDYAPY